MTSIVDYLIRIIQYECNHLDAHYQHADSLRSHCIDDNDIYGISLATILPDRPLPPVIQRDLYVPRPPSHLFTYEADQLFNAFYAPHRNNYFLLIYHQIYLCSIPSVNNTTTRHYTTYSIKTPLIHLPPNTAISIIQPVTSIPSILVTSYSKHTTLKRFSQSS